MQFIEFIKNTISLYSFMAILGIIAAGIAYFLLSRERTTSVRERIFMFIYALLGVFAGGHLMFFIVGLPDWIRDYSGRILSTADFLDAFADGASGMVFYGGLFGALLAIVWFCRVHHLYTRSELNCAVTVFPLFHAFGRIGCALTGCCYGIEYHGPLAMQFEQWQIVPGRTDDLVDFTRFPVQLLEAFLNAALFIALLIFYKKTKDKYSITCVYLISYGIIRFFDEFLRGDAIRGIWGPFSTSQWLSLIVIAASVVYLILKRTKRGVSVS